MELSGLVIGTYLAVLLVLAFYGFHRTALVWLYYKHRDHKPKPAAARPLPGAGAGRQHR
jgi:hypothetical protein